MSTDVLIQAIVAIFQPFVVQDQQSLKDKYPKSCRSLKCVFLFFICDRFMIFFSLFKTVLSQVTLLKPQRT